MSRFLPLVIGAFALLTVAPLSAHAIDSKGNRLYSSKAAASTEVPELDPNAAFASIALVIGGAVLLRQRSRRHTA